MAKKPAKSQPPKKGDGVQKKYGFHQKNPNPQPYDSSIVRAAVRGLGTFGILGAAAFANRKDFENTNRQAPGYRKKTAAPASSPKAKPAAPKKVVLGPPAPKAKPAAKKGKR